MDMEVTDQTNFLLGFDTRNPDIVEDMREAFEAFQIPRIELHEFHTKAVFNEYNPTMVPENREKTIWGQVPLNSVPAGYCIC